MLWQVFTRWYLLSLIAALVGLVSVWMIWRRSNRGRWLAIGALLAMTGNSLVYEFMGPRAMWRSLETTEDAITYAISLTIGMLPTIALIALLTIGKRTNAYFGGSQPEAVVTEPPPPPVFEG